MSDALTSCLGFQGVLEGAVAASTFLAICFATVCEPPVFGCADDNPSHTTVRRAVNLPSLMAWRMASGTRPTESRPATSVKSSDALSLTNTEKRWSDVIPDGPAAAPRRALLRQIKNSSEFNSNCSTGWVSATALLNPSLGIGGRLSGSVSALRVCHRTWGHGRTFECLSRCRQLPQVHKGQSACDLSLLTNTLTTPSAD